MAMKIFMKKLLKYSSDTICLTFKAAQWYYTPPQILSTKASATTNVTHCLVALKK